MTGRASYYIILLLSGISVLAATVTVVLAGGVVSNPRRLRPADLEVMSVLALLALADAWAYAGARWRWARGAALGACVYCLGLLAIVWLSWYWG